MENTTNNAKTPVTKADLKAEFGKFGETLDRKLDERLSEQTKATEQLLADQANVILEAVGELMEKEAR
jgi:hypothetical protein